MLFFSSAVSQTPDLKFKKISIEQGLSNSWIEAIFQDHKGFIWIASRDGLNRYDGQQVKVYRNNANDSTSISDNFIRCIYEDRQHNLWIGTSNGLNLLNRNTDSFIRFNHNNANKKSISDNGINCIYQDVNTNKIWIGTLKGGVSVYDQKDHAFMNFRLDHTRKNSLSSDNVADIYQDINKNIWLATTAGLNRFEPQDNSFSSYYNAVPGIPGAVTNSLKSVQGDNKGNLWLGTNYSGIIYFNTRSNTYKLYSHQLNNPLSLSGNEVCDILVDKKGNLWIGLINEGLDLYDPVHDSFIHHKHEFNSYSLSQKTASCIYEDHQGNLWVGTHRGGVSLYASTAGRFNLYRQGESSNTISSSDVRAICQDRKGNIWVGTDGAGMNLFDHTTNTFKRYLHDAKNTKTIGSDAVLDIIQDNIGNIWVSTWSGGLDLFDPVSGTFTLFKNAATDTNSISSDFVQKAYQDKEGHLWVGTYHGGLNLLDPVTHKFKRIIKSPNGKTSLSGDNIVSINGDKAGNVWFGTDDAGLNCYNLNTKTFSHYFDHEGRFPDLRVIFVDHKGRVWVGEKGLYLFDPIKNNFKLYTSKFGLNTEYIRGITEDENGNMWISTSNGLTRFDPNTFTAQKFNIKDGLQGMEFEPNAFLKAANGEMFFGGTDGLNTFFPDLIKTNTFIAPVYITDFKIFNKRIIAGQQNSPLTGDITDTKQIKLTYDQSSLTFDFAALNYVVADNNQYAYKLEGFDKEWNYAGNRRTTTYTNLSPGHYVLHVKASNNDGVWNEKGTSIFITITPPFWETWWFETLTVLIIVGGAYAYYRNRIDNIKKQRALLEKQVKERTAEVVQKAEELQDVNEKLHGLNEELHTQSEELSKQADDLKRLNAELGKQKEQELEKALAQGKFEVASEVLHDVGNAMVGFGSYLSRINGVLERNNIDTIKNLAAFIKGQQEGIAGLIGPDKAAALVSITNGLSKTQATNHEEISAAVNEIMSIITHIQEILDIQSQFVRGHDGVHERKAVDLSSLIDNCKIILLGTLDKKGVQFKTDIKPGSYIIKGDHSKLTQVLLNILKNSIEAIDQQAVDKQITLDMQMAGPMIQIVIKDNGQGFNLDTANNLSERGFTTKRARAGLGLYNCRSIIESHSGSFAIKSEGIGMGAVVTIQFAI